MMIMIIVVLLPLPLFNQSCSGIWASLVGMMVVFLSSFFLSGLASLLVFSRISFASRYFSSVLPFWLSCLRQKRRFKEVLLEAEKVILFEGNDEFLPSCFSPSFSPLELVLNLFSFLDSNEQQDDALLSFWSSCRFELLPEFNSVDSFPSVGIEASMVLMVMEEIAVGISLSQRWVGGEEGWQDRSRKKTRKGRRKKTNIFSENLLVQVLDHHQKESPSLLGGIGFMVFSYSIAMSCCSNCLQISFIFADFVDGAFNQTLFCPHFSFLYILLVILLYSLCSNTSDSWSLHPWIEGRDDDRSKDWIEPCFGLERDSAAWSLLFSVFYFSFIIPLFILLFIPLCNWMGAKVMDVLIMFFIWIHRRKLMMTRLLVVTARLRLKLDSLLISFESSWIIIPPAFSPVISSCSELISFDLFSS